MELKPNNYYLDKDNKLIYLIGKSKLGGTYVPQYLWDFKCLSSGVRTRMDDESLLSILVTDLGTNISPAMRLLYGSRI